MMAISVTINLPEELYDRAKRFAHLTNRDIESIITDTMMSMLPTIDDQVDRLPPIDQLTDPEIMILATSQMPTPQDNRLSELLGRQRENQLIESESNELAKLMQIYQEGLLRKTTALVEAIKRGLMEPMDS